MRRDRRHVRGRWLLALAGLLLVSYLLAPAAVAHPAPAASAQTAPQPTATTTVPPADQSQQAQQAQQKANRCDHLSNPVARNACRAATVPADLVGGAAASVAGNIVSSAGDSALRSFTNAVAAAGK